MSRPMRHHARGVTLMELMVVMVVVAILAAIAIPSYRNYMIRVTRTDAKRDLLATSQALERCFTRFNAYNNAGCPAAAVAAAPQTNAEGTYTVSAVITAATFTLTATPQGGQANDADCANFTLNQLGQQGITGSATAVRCWTGRR